MRPRRWLIAAAALAVAVWAGLQPAGTASPPPTPAAGWPLPAGGLSGAIVFTQLPAGSRAEKPPAEAGGMLRAGFGEGARLVLRGPDGTLRVLTPDFHSAADPEISFDGQKILFAAKKTAEDDWNIFEMSADGSGARQITRSLGDCRSPIYQSAIFYLDDAEVSYQVTFVSTASGTYDEYGPTNATNLYSAKLDGSGVRRLTFNPSSSLDPFIVPDGRIIFASWNRATLARGPLGRIDLFGINLDGTDYAAFSGEQGRRVKHMGSVTPKRLVVFIEGDSMPWDGAGSLASLSLRRNLHSYRRIPAPPGLYHSPSPLPDSTVLVSRRPLKGGGTHGIYRLDPETGRSDLVFNDPKHHDIQAKALAPRREPDGRSSVVEDHVPTAVLYCLNLYEADLNPEWMPSGSVKRLRVLEGLPRAVAANGGPERRWTPDTLLEKRFLGEINVEEDGSFQVQVPANIPIQLQALDADGIALRSTAWMWAKNKENRGCIGCHEDGERTPENVLAQALRKPAAQLTLPPERRRTVDFARDVAPILTAKCSTPACHGGAAPPRLDGAAAVRQHVTAGQARTSPLVWHIFGRVTARPWDKVAAAELKPMPPAGSPLLTEDEKRTIIEWIDLGAHGEKP